MSDPSNRPEGNKGQFASAAGTSEPPVSSSDKHQPGKLVGNDNVPTFNAQTLPAGSAPADRTFQPNPTDSVPQDGTTAASDTIQGATSGDVHTGLGHPGAGQSSAELRHDGQAHRKNVGGGGYEASGASVGQGGINAHDPQFAGQRALDKDEAVVGRGGKADAQDREPVSAEGVASERK